MPLSRGHTCHARRLAIGLLALLATTGAREPSARAHDKRACVAASDQGQGLRLDGKLTAAREQLLVCADATCPSIVRAACAGWLVDLDRQIPSVILVARDASGDDVLGATVAVDGGPAQEVSGRPVSLDPGSHTIHFQTPAGAVVDRTVVLAEGEQRRIIDGVFRAGPSALPTSPPVPAATATPLVTSGRSNVPWAAWGFTAGAAVAWGVFGGFALDGHLEYESAASSCDGRCPPSRYSPIDTKFIVADVSLGVAVVATGVAAVLFLTHSSAKVAPTTGGAATVLAF